MVGKQAGDFTLGKKSTETIGSDHFAVFTRFLFSEKAPKAALSTTGSLKRKSGVWISALLPNPEGRDEGNEWLTLKNGGADPVNLTGWALRDKAGHTVKLSGILAPETELKVRLASGQMPLNNGDDIALVNGNGQIVHAVSYAAGQVSPGRQIPFGR